MRPPWSCGLGGGDAARGRSERTASSRHPSTLDEYIVHAGEKVAAGAIAFAKRLRVPAWFTDDGDVCPRARSFACHSTAHGSGVTWPLCASGHWLQAFRDYAFGGRPYTTGEITAQIKAAEDCGANGWMLWNPRNRYAAGDLKP